MKPFGALAIIAIIALASCHRETYDEKKFRETTEYNHTHCPQRWDQFTVLDSMHYADSPRTMEYHYTLQGRMDNDSLYTSDMLEAFRQQIEKMLHSSLDVKDLKDHKTTFVYVYTSESTHKELMRLKFTPKEYGK